jgi:3-methyl-2-oxobutanoate hydroxymethyltransferase
MAEPKLTIPDIRARKGETPLTMLTAYDYPTALLVDGAGIDLILVGDSLAMVVLGHPDTVSVTMAEMLHHTRAVSRAARRSVVVGDLPFGAYNVSLAQAVENANRFMKEGRADCVKLEGGGQMVETAAAIVRSGTPVMGHLGLTPQTAGSLGGFKVQGRSVAAAEALLADARALEAAGCFALVLEAVPAPLAKMVTERISIPTIGIGAGADCDGQVLVLHDMVGLFDRFVPRFVQQYAQVGAAITEAVTRYKDDVMERRFPEEKHSFSMKAEELAALEEALGAGKE